MQYCPLTFPEIGAIIIIEIEREVIKMTKQEIKAMLGTIEQKIIYEDDDYIDIENINYGKCISFVFENDKLIKIVS
mgnify:CR=1 FL=1